MEGLRVRAFVLLASGTGERVKPFTYFKNPTQPLSSWTEEAKACHFCSELKPGFSNGYSGPEDLEHLCEGCLRSGRLSEIEMSSCSGDEKSLRAQLAAARPALDDAALSALVKSRTAELEHSTPHLQTWQDLDWPAHCGDYCQFVEEVGKPELTELAGEEDPIEWFCRNTWETCPDVWEAVRDLSAREHPDQSYDLTVYRFLCRECAATVLHWDAS